MYLQGDLQKVFDALFDMGVIDPVLKEDWTQALEEMHHFYPEVERAMGVVNQYQFDVEELIIRLEAFDQKTLGYVAMEVAKEFADFHSRGEVH